MGLFHRKREKKIPDKKYDILAQDVRPKGATRPSHQHAGGSSAADIRRARVDRALQAFLSAPDWEATHTNLLRDQDLLLADDAQIALADFVEQARRQEHGETQAMANYLEAHRILLDRARSIGVEAAWQEFRASGVDEPDDTPHDPETQAVSELMKRLLGTNNWADTYTLLVEERERLTSDIADQFLSALIQMARQNPSGQAHEGVHYLEMHRTLLRETRTIGLDAAWENFERTRRQLEAESGQRPTLPNTSDADLSLVAHALKTLLSTENWSETRQILEREQRLLLTEACDQLLSELLSAAQRDDDPRALRGAVYLGLHRRLLRRAREEGIDQAWTEFEVALAEAMGNTDAPEAIAQSVTVPAPDAPPSAPDVASAVQAFLGAPNWGFALDILYARQRTLLSAEAITLVHAQAEALRQRGTGRDIYAAQLLDQQARVLQRAREVGIERAWEEFEAERD